MTGNQLRARRRIVLVYIYVIWVIWGVLAAAMVEPARTEATTRVDERAFLIVGLACQLGFMWFCTVDARLAGRPLLRLARIGIFFGWPLGVPIYLFWAHGLRGLATLALHALSLTLVFIASGVLTLLLCPSI
jgi:hypothetical protein